MKKINVTKATKAADTYSLDTDNKEIGQRLKKYRNTLPDDMKPAHIPAKVLGITQSGYYNLEAGRKMWSVRQIKAVCVLYGLDIAVVMGMKKGEIDAQ